MTTFDPSVWTSEKPDPRKWHWFAENNGDDDAPWLDCRARFPTGGCVRSIHPIPSAEEIAALVELGDAVKALEWSEVLTFEGGMDAKLYLSVDQLNAVRAALARLDAARKERGA